MKDIKFFAVISAAAVIAASMLSGCTDHNESYIERSRTETVTTTEGIVEWTTKAQTTTKKAKKTTSAADEDSVTTTKKSKNKNKKTASSEEYTDTTTTTAVFDSDDGTYVEYHFRSKKLLNQHFEKHGSEFDGDFDYASAAEYEKGASDVINNSSALHKTEAEDGDGVYYIEDTNEFVILSTDGYIRTYFRPNGGIDYYNRQ
ncbi:MAG: hypothetical protein IKH96_13485 [Ruminococcus sp.]|uniref:hypothetical protein n=1 Tax=Ruminococcus sp. TaxID=41978 RepID=UPI0025F8B434|nr:hypothetical protein [Ruminococcus sp.]MBR6997008.1 hypothetical protein [Ruminococcus sp.]